jgi:hypothetical protein
MYVLEDADGTFKDWNGSEECFEKRFCGMSHEIMD